MKGLSPLIATVLLIAFTVAVAGIVSLWVTNFTNLTTKQIQNQTTMRVNCTFASIALSNVNYCSTSSYLSGQLSNNGVIAFGSVSLQEVYNNGSSPIQPLCLSGSSVVSCSSSNLTISPGYLYAFNVSGVSTGFSLVNVITDCIGVTDNTKTWTSNC